MDTLPLEIWWMILKTPGKGLFKGKNVAKLMGVCKNWRRRLLNGMTRKLVGALQRQFQGDQPKIYELPVNRERLWRLYIEQLGCYYTVKEEARELHEAVDNGIHRNASFSDGEHDRNHCWCIAIPLDGGLGNEHFRLKCETLAERRSKRSNYKDLNNIFLFYYNL